MHRDQTEARIFSSRVVIGRAMCSLAWLGFAVAQDAIAVSVFNTGVDAVGSKLAVGSADPHWQLVAGPGVTAPSSVFVVNNQHPSGQYFATADSSWVWGAASGAATLGSPYTFRLQFDLTGLDASTATLSGAWGVDNVGSITVNGAAPIGTGTFSLATVAYANFDSLHSFTVNGGFVQGINQLDVQVTDAGNPGGFNFSNMSVMAAAVPEPSSVAMLSAGIITLLGLARRSRKGALAAC